MIRTAKRTGQPVKCSDFLDSVEESKQGCHMYIDRVGHILVANTKHDNELGAAALTVQTFARQRIIQKHILRILLVRQLFRALRVFFGPMINDALNYLDSSY